MFRLLKKNKFKKIKITRKINFLNKFKFSFIYLNMFIIVVIVPIGVTKVNREEEKWTTQIVYKEKAKKISTFTH